MIPEINQTKHSTYHSYERDKLKGNISLKEFNS